MDRINYLYAVFRPNGVICYIGKGSGDRWKRHDARAKANAHYKALLNKYKILPTVIFRENLTEQEAFNYERILTRSIGLESEGGPLINIGHGGRGGPIGIKRSVEWCEVRKLRAKEVWERPDYREVILRKDRNRSGNSHPRTDEFKKIVSQKLKGNTHTLGRVIPEEEKLRRSLAIKGRHNTPEHNRNIGLGHLGLKRSAEARENMRNAQFKIIEMKQASCIDLMGFVSRYL